MERVLVDGTNAWEMTSIQDVRMQCILQHLPCDIDTEALVNALSTRNRHLLVPLTAALCHLGIRSKKAVDRLSAMLVEEDDCELEFYKIAAVTLGRLWNDEHEDSTLDGLFKDLEDEDSTVRARAVAILGSVRSRDRISTAIAALERALNDPVAEIRRLAVYSLGRLGQPAIPSLIKCVRTSKELYFEALEALSSIDAPITAKLIEVYGDCGLETRKMIVWAIGKIHDDPTIAVPFLVRVLDDPNVNLCWQAMAALEEYGPAAAEAVPRLTYALTHEYERSTRTKSSLREDFTEEPLNEYFAEDESLSVDLEAVSAIAKTLGAIGPSARPAIPCLMQLLDDNGDRIRTAALKAICRIGPSEDEYLRLIDHLTKDRNSEDWSVGSLAAQRWSGELEVMLSAPLPARILKQIIDFYLKDSHPIGYGVASPLATAIRNSDARDDIAMIVAAVGETDDRVVDLAVSLLVEMGDLPASAVSILVKAFDIGDQKTRWLIVRALDRVAEAESVLPVLLEALQQDDLRSTAAEAVGRVRVRSNELLSILREGMDHWSGSDRLSAAFAAHRLDPPANGPLELLGAGLKSDEEGARRYALELLIEIGEPALPIVVDAFLDPDLNDYVYDYFMHEVQAQSFVAPEDFAPELLRFLEREDARLREQGAYLAGMFPVGPDNALMIARLWHCLLDENEHTRRYCAWALRAIVSRYDNRVEEDAD